MIQITLSYNDSLFELKTALGVVLWSGAFLTLPQAKEFARAYVSSFIGAYVEQESQLDEKFYTERKEREQKFLYGEKV